MSRIGGLISTLCLVLWLTILCRATVHDVLCKEGNGAFQAHLRTGISVLVGPQKKGLLSTRACRASISWGDQQLVIADSAAQIDLDSFGVDMEGIGPVAGFQIKHSDVQCCMAYQIYSLEIPPRLLRTITGGQSFRAADTDLDGRVEIWTDDAHAVNGLEGFSAREMAFVPVVVLRFEHGKLLDVSSEFTSYFDDVIARIRTNLDSERLRDFRASDGKLQGSISLSDKHLGQLGQLRTTKLKLLEILWAYLYSRREQDAWRFLTSVWPPQDTERIRSALLNTRAHGIISLVDGSSTGGGPAKRAVKVYRQSQVRPAQPIMVRCYPRCGQGPANADLRVNLVIDAAGKVRSVQPIGARADETITRAAEEWKFIPASRNGRSVASHLKGTISALR